MLYCLSYSIKNISGNSLREEFIRGTVLSYIPSFLKLMSC